MWPFKSRQPDPPGGSFISLEQLGRALEVFWGSGAHFSTLYANMGGYPRNVIDVAGAAEHSRLIQAEPAFTPTGSAYAARRLVEDLDVVCAGGTFDRIAFGLDGRENAASRGDLLALKTGVANRGAARLFADLGFDSVSWLTAVTTRRRLADLERVRARLDGRREYLKPLLLRARAKGQTKYGDMDWGPYVEELSEFLDHYFPQGSLPFFYNRPPVAYAIDYVEPWFSQPLHERAMPLDGIDFEHWCAAHLQQQGWLTRVSQASGDQGVDIEAMRGDRMVAIQCKRYDQPIGNKAVQEAYAGMVHYQAHAAVVLGTGGFTPAARELAASTGVILLDAANIGEFTEIVSAR